jgi:hypothetical protein
MDKEMERQIDIDIFEDWDDKKDRQTNKGMNKLSDTQANRKTYIHTIKQTDEKQQKYWQKSGQ